MVDVDEYFHAFNKAATLDVLFGLYPDAKQVSLPWLMCPSVPLTKSASTAEFWGHIGKPACRSEAISGISSCHSFSTEKKIRNKVAPTVPLGPHGVAIIHYWSRTFRDCLLKTFSTRLVNSKSSDQQHALTIIRRGALPIRMRLLAYLANQSAFIPVPSAPVQDYDLQLEEELLRRWLPESDAENLRASVCGISGTAAKIAGASSALPLDFLDGTCPIAPFNVGNALVELRRMFKCPPIFDASETDEQRTVSRIRMEPQVTW
jgi:hypothetical protein